jgi:hypothetical protein
MFIGIRQIGNSGVDMKMSEEEWIKTLKDGRKVKFIYQELPRDARP